MTNINNNKTQTSRRHVSTTKPLYFKAQALDNISPDHYQIGDELICVDDLVLRTQVTNMIHAVALNGTTELAVDDAELILQNRYFLAQVYSKQLDCAGRWSPIVCCGELTNNDDPEAIVQAIQDFAKQIGRTVDSRHIKIIRDGLESKLNSQNIGNKLFIAAAASAAVIIGTFIWKKL